MVNNNNNEVWNRKYKACPLCGRIIEAGRKHCAKCREEKSEMARRDRQYAFMRSLQPF